MDSKQLKLAGASLMFLSACAPQQEPTSSGLSQYNQSFSFDFLPPDSFVEFKLYAFSHMQLSDDEMSFLNDGLTAALGAGSGEDAMLQFMQGQYILSLHQQDEFTRAVNFIAATPVGRELMREIEHHYDRIYVAYDGFSTSMIRKFADDATVLVLGGFDRDVRYYCDDILGGTLHAPSYESILYHELYHLAHHMHLEGADFERMNEQSLYSSINFENQAVTATDLFAGSYLSDCPRVDYYNGMLEP